MQGNLKPSEASKNLAIFEGRFQRLKEERDNVWKAKEALELAEPGVGLNLGVSYSFLCPLVLGTLLL